MQEEALVYTPGYLLKEKILKKELSCLEVTRCFLKRIERLNPSFNTYTLILAEKAIEQAQYIDDHLPLLQEAPLLGIPVSIKDLILDIEGEVTTNGSMLCKEMIAKEDSLSVSELRKAHAVFLDKTNVPEFGSGYITQNRLGPPARNPWNPHLTPGGSSGGAAASVIAGLASCALANDSAGSIRLPSSFCSLFGYMPSFGRVPCISPQELPLKPLQRIGPITRTVKDAALILDVIGKYCPKDPDQKASIRFEDIAETEPKGLKLAWSPDLTFGIYDPEAQEIIRKKLISLEKMGCIIEEVKLPVNFAEHIETMTHYIMARFTLLNEHIPIFARPLLGSPIAHLIKKASDISCIDFLKATTFRELVRQKMQELMQKYDLLLTPTTPMPAFDIESYPEFFEKKSLDPYAFFASRLYPFNFTGQPAASLPCGLNREKLPIGLQVIGPENNDSGIFGFCSFFEKAFPWLDLYPKAL